MGWKQDLVLFFFPIFLVEREPMWDGNFRRTATALAAGTSLSENQCGMETRCSASCGRAGLRVEREPMWDGNKNQVRQIGGRAGR